MLPTGGARSGQHSQRPMPAGAWRAPRAIRPRNPVRTPRTGLRPPLGTDGPLSGGQPKVLLICGKARPHRVWPADPLKPGRDLGVIQVRVIAALADELKSVGVAAFYPALHDAGRAAPQGRRAAVAGLTSRREGRQTLVMRSA
jgi:hypothetical protein